MTAHVGVGGAWQEISKIHIGVSGAWQEVQAAWIGVGGAWQKFYQNLRAALAGGSYSHTAASPANATSGVKVDSDGYIYRLNGATYVQQTQWLLGGTAAEFECRWTNTSGSLSSGSAGTWQTCGSDQGFNITYTSDSPGNNSCTGTLEIRMAASPNTVLASASYTINAIVTA